MNHLLPSHMFGERGLMRLGARNATVLQSSPGIGKLFKLSGLDYQAIKEGQDPLAVRSRVCSTALLAVD